MATDLTKALEYAINEAIAMTLESAKPCPQGLINEHFSMWRGIPPILTEQGLEVTVSVLELARKIADMAETEKSE